MRRNTPAPTVTPAERREAEERFARLQETLTFGETLTVRFTSKGTRRAKVVRTRPVRIQTYSPTKGTWSNERRLVVDDLLLYRELA